MEVDAQNGNHSSSGMEMVLKGRETMGMAKFILEGHKTARSKRDIEFGEEALELIAKVCNNRQVRLLPIHPHPFKTIPDN